MCEERREPNSHTLAVISRTDLETPCEDDLHLPDEVTVTHEGHLYLFSSSSGQMMVPSSGLTLYYTLKIKAQIQFHTFSTNLTI